MILHKEISFESEICQHLADHGWLYAETVTYPLHKFLNTVTIDTYRSFSLQIVACTLKCNN